METTPTPDSPAPAAPAAPKPKGPPKSYVQTVTDGAGNQLRAIALRRKDGTWSSFAVLYDKTEGKGKDGKAKTVYVRKQRGATDTHADEGTARKAVAAIVDQAVKQGYVKRTASVGVGRAPQDSFDLKNLPAPRKSAKK